MYRSAACSSPLRVLSLPACFRLPHCSWLLQGANDEPYLGYRRYDAIVQVGVGSALIVLWCCYCIAVALLVAARKLSVAWLVLLLWGAICVFYLSYSPLGYLEDIEKFVLPAAGGGR